MDALRQLAAAYATRCEAVPATLGGRPAVAYIGRDVPRELLAAAGFAPFRLAGDPARRPDLAEPICGPGIDGLARAQLDRILRGDLARCRGLVISADCEGSVRLYLYLRELQRLEPRAGIPPFTFVDVLHLPHRTSTLYTERQLDALAATLTQWGGAPVTDAALHEAVATYERLRAQVRAVGETLRRADLPKLTGVEALQVVGASFVLPPQAWLTATRDLLAAPDQLPGRPGKRVFLTGSGHDHPAAYELLESHGVVVVGEDHDWGDLAGEPLPAGRSALADGYAHAAPAAAGSGLAERAAYTACRARDARADLVIAWIRQHDTAPGWDVPAQRAALRERGIPLVALPAQPYAATTSGLAAIDTALAGAAR